MLTNVKVHLRGAIALSFLLTLLALSACGSSGSDKQVSVETVYWITENLNRDAEEPGPTARVRFRLIFAEEDLSADDFASIRIEDPSQTLDWVFDETEDFEERFDAEYGNFLTPFLVSSRLDGGSVLPIGTYTFTITLKNGNSNTATLLVPAPNSLGTDGNSFVYTEDFSGADAPPAGYTPLPRRGTIEAATLEADSLDVTFSVESDVIYSGWLWAFDAEGEYVGKSEDLRVYETGTISAGLNGGAALLTDGTSNQLSLSPSRFEFKEGRSFEDVASIYLVLTDGEQYLGTDTDLWDNRSVSSKFEVSVSD